MLAILTEAAANVQAVPAVAWLGFHLFVVAMLALDLGVFHRKDHVVSIREALGWSVFWIALSLIFAGGVWHWMGRQAGLEFLTAYIVEKSLSVDNLFVFLLIFHAFHVPQKHQHKVLFWGIIGALVMRAAFILGGVALLNRFHWVLYVFGAFLVYTGAKLMFGKDEEEKDPGNNALVRLARRFIPVTEEYRGGKFFVRDARRWAATPLFIVILAVESSDLLFAVDSIPAVISISRDPFVIYTSNVFAILGLRALYFAVAAMMGRFRFLKQGLSVILTFIGIKMLISDLYHLPVAITLAFIALVLTVSVAASWRLPAPPPPGMPPED